MSTITVYKANPRPESPLVSIILLDWSVRERFHALTAVQAFCTGRLLPLVENSDIHRLRMSMRTIGSKLEGKFARMQPLTRSAIARRRLSLAAGNVLGPPARAGRAFLGSVPGVRPAYRAVRRLLSAMGVRAAGL
jgi:hypothetical protein